MSLENKEGWIWKDGEWVRWQDATTHVLSHGLHYGTSIFEGVRCYHTHSGPAIFRLQDHTERFFQSAHVIDMKIPFSADSLKKAQCEVVTKNNLDCAYIRPVAFYGANSLGISAKNNPVHVAIAAWNWSTYLGQSALEEGIRVKTSSFSRMHVNSNMCSVAKVGGNYINSVLAYNEVSTDGYDEALLLDVNGFIAEGAGENIFIVRKGKIYTPGSTSVLNGITRDSLLHLAADMEIEVVERNITRDFLYCADEAFFTGTAAEVTPIREIDNRQIGNGKKGEITASLQENFFSNVKGNGKYSSVWLTPCAE